MAVSAKRDASCTTPSAYDRWRKKVLGGEADRRLTGSNALRYRAHHALAELHEARGRPALALRHYRPTSLLVRAEAADAEREAEIHRLRHVELARLVEQLEEANRQLEQANADKAHLVDELQLRAEELERMAREDSLTGLANRRHMTERLEAEYVRARRFGRDLTAVMVDADHCKGGQRPLLARGRRRGAAAAGPRPGGQLPGRGCGRAVGW